jgi:hypothetical protein
MRLLVRQRREVAITGRRIADLQARFAPRNRYAPARAMPKYSRFLQFPADSEFSGPAKLEAASRSGIGWNNVLGVPLDGGVSRWTKTNHR